MELNLKRKLKLEDRTIGELSIDGVKYCDTLEDKERLSWSLVGGIKKLLGVKVYGETCIPTGRYEILLCKSPHFKRTLPCLLNVPQFTGILIHSGNKPADTLGCILVGKKTNDNQVYGGKTLNIESKLVEQIQKAIKKSKVYITIE